MIMKPTTTPGKASGKVSSATREAVPLQEEAGDCGDRQRRDGRRGRENDRVDERPTIARLDEDRGVGGGPGGSSCADGDEAGHGKEKEGDHRDGEREEA